MAAVELGGAVYIIGGVTDPSGSTVSSKVYRYLPATESFDADTIASLPAPRGFLSACAAGGKIYAIGGATAFIGAVHNEVYVYDPAVNNWTTLPNGLAIARAAFTSAVVGNKIYVMGGTITWITAINSVEVYDFNNSHWVNNTVHLSNARMGHGSAVLSDIIYALGGIESTSSAEMSVEAFGPEIAGGDSWETFNDLTYDRRAFGCVAWPTDGPYSYIYIMGGNSGSAAISSTQRLLVNTVEASEVSPALAEKVNTTLSNFPNPFDQYTTISYTVGTSANIVISIFDAAGKLIYTPVSGLQTPGEHRVSFDGAKLEAGVYFCVMKSEDGTGFARKMVVMR
ncbi:MAG: T9SS type A sorting domain-containing protein [Saprospiraceae bacterium]|nr:T9SS type A sorting domain-containing protein [Saprospiraceae bacterium]